MAFDRVYTALNNHDRKTDNYIVGLTFKLEEIILPNFVIIELLDCILGF